MFKVWVVLAFASLLLRNTAATQADSYPEQNHDGNIPFVNVEMQPSQRWKDARMGLDRLKKELSYVVDREIEKAKTSLIDKLDTASYIQSPVSQIKLLQHKNAYRNKTQKVH